VYIPGKTNLAVSLVNAGQVDLGDEGNLGRGVGVVLAATDLQTVNTVLVHTLSDAKSMAVLIEIEG